MHRADHPKRTPGPKVHLDFEIDVLPKTMLTVVKDSVVNPTKSVVKIVVSVIDYGMQVSHESDLKVQKLKLSNRYITASLKRFKLKRGKNAREDKKILAAEDIREHMARQRRFLFNKAGDVIYDQHSKCSDRSKASKGRHWRR